LESHVNTTSIQTTALPLLSRQSFRRFEGERFELSSLAALLKNLNQCCDLKKGQIEVLVYAKPALPEKLGKAMRFDGNTGNLISVTDVTFDPDLHGQDNRDVFERSRCEVYLVGLDAERDTLLNVGRLSQRIMSLAPEFSLGFCPVGNVDQEIVKSNFSLPETSFVIHSLLGGSVSEQQLSRLSSVHDASNFNANPIEEVASFLSARLPDYMQPDQIFELDALPLSSNGKVARDRLPKPEQIVETHSSYKAPSTKLEKKLVNYWEEVLECKKVGVQDDFFAIGGNSVLLVRLHSRLQMELNMEISIMDLFRFPSIAGFANCLEQPSTGGKQDTNISLKDQAEDAKGRAQQQAQAMRKFGHSRQATKGER